MADLNISNNPLSNGQQYGGRSYAPRGAVVIAAPWPRSGSSNIFKLKHFFAKAGLEVALLVGPCDYWHSEYNAQLQADVQEGYNWPSVKHLSWASFGRNVRSAKIKGWLRWILAGRDSELNIQSRMACETSFTEGFKRFLLTHDIEFIYANHVFQVGLAEKVAKFLVLASRKRPQIIVESHDVQSTVNVKAWRKNTFSRAPDVYQQLVHDEVSLLSKADKITHLSAQDMDFFCKFLPRDNQFLVLPTLSPATERELMSLRGSGSKKLIDFLFVGNNHTGNVLSLKWFFEHVLPHLGDDVSICIVGSIKDHFKYNELALYEKHEALFVGEAPDITPFYNLARVIIIPVMFGTGVSIKFVEAMCMGKPIVASELAFRGLPETLAAQLPLKAHSTPVGFANAMLETLKNAETIGPKYSNFYDQHLSLKCFYNSLSRVTGHASRLQKEVYVRQ